MKRLNIEKTLKLLQKVDKNIICINNYFYRSDEIEPLFFYKDGDQKLINIIENNNTQHHKNNVGFIINYLHQHKDEIIFDGYIEEDLRDVIINELHLEIDHLNQIKFYENKTGARCAISFKSFADNFLNKKFTNSFAENLLATIVKNKLKGE